MVKSNWSNEKTPKKKGKKKKKKGKVHCRGCKEAMGVLMRCE